VSFAIAGLLQRDFKTSVDQMPLLGQIDPWRAVPLDQLPARRYRIADRGHGSSGGADPAQPGSSADRPRA
jgi:hypothetical protein